MYRKVIIIPNEKILDVPLFEEETMELGHMQLVKQFAKQCNLNINIESEAAINYNLIIIEVLENNMVVSFIPPEISEKQYNYLLKLESYLKRFPEFVAGIYLPTGEVEISYLDYDKEENIVNYYLSFIKEKCLESLIRK